MGGERLGAAGPSHPRLLLDTDDSDCVGVSGCGSRVTAVCQGLCSLLQMAQPVAPMVPKLPTLIDQGHGSHGLGNVDLLLWFGLWGLWGLFGGLGSPSRDSQDNRSALTQLPPTVYQLPQRTLPSLNRPSAGAARTHFIHLHRAGRPIKLLSNATEPGDPSVKKKKKHAPGSSKQNPPGKASNPSP